MGLVVVQVVTKRLSDGYAGYTDGVNIFLDDRLSSEQMLCTVLHESIHLERGHVGHQSEAVEMSVRYETARRLLPLDRIVGVCKDGKSLGSIARDLSVTRQVLMDRAATLTDSQASDAGCWECQKCPAIQMRAAMMVPA